jgi:hypothetical protein
LSSSAPCPAPPRPVHSGGPYPPAPARARVPLQPPVPHSPPPSAAAPGEGSVCRPPSLLSPQLLAAMALPQPTTFRQDMPPPGGFAKPVGFPVSGCVFVAADPRRRCRRLRRVHRPHLPFPSPLPPPAASARSLPRAAPRAPSSLRAPWASSCTACGSTTARWRSASECGSGRTTRARQRPRGTARRRAAGRQMCPSWAGWSAYPARAGGRAAGQPGTLGAARRVG